MERWVCGEAGLASHWKRWARGGAVLGVLLLGTGVGALRAAEWRDELTLWGAELDHPPVGFIAYQNLGAALAERGRPIEAWQALRMAWREQPGHPVVFRSLLRLGVQGASPGGRALDPASLKELLAEGLAVRPRPDALRAWSQRLTMDPAQHALARVLDEMARSLEPR
jgi:hypothetical protein